MGHSQAEKTQSRERILVAASRQLRDAGIAGLSIAEVMKEAGLTHGGFYSHFQSRSELIAAALERALSESKVAQGALSGHDALARCVVEYLSRSHRDNPEKACAVSVLGSEVVRADADARAVMDDHLRRYFQGIADLLEDPVQREKAIPLVCTMVGALTLSRLINDPDFSDSVLRKSREFVLAVAGVAPAAPGKRRRVQASGRRTSAKSRR